MHTFHSDIGKQEQRHGPSDTALCCRFHASFFALGTRVALTKPLASALGEDGAACGHLCDQQSGHDVVERVPLQMVLGHHGGDNNWRNRCSDAIKAVHEPKQLVSIGQIAHPGIVASLFRVC